MLLTVCLILDMGLGDCSPLPHLAMIPYVPYHHLETADMPHALVTIFSCPQGMSAVSQHVSCAGGSKKTRRGSRRPDTTPAKNSTALGVFPAGGGGSPFFVFRESQFGP